MLTVVDPAALRREVQHALAARAHDVVFDEEPELAARAIALAAHLEIGTPTDQLTPQLRAADGKTAIATDAAVAELIDYRGTLGLRVRYRGHDRLQPGWLRPLLHPSLSFNADGTARELVIFPRSVARIAAREQASLVIVPSWARDLALGKSSPHRPYYEAWADRDAWRSVPAWLLRYCDLLAHKRIACFTTHDLADHVAGFRAAQWPRLVALASRLGASLARYFADSDGAPPLPSLILPFLAGHLLDSLAQPRILEAAGPTATVIELLIDAIDARVISPRSSRTLRRFPASYNALVASTHAPGDDFVAEARRRLAVLVDQIEQARA